MHQSHETQGYRVVLTDRDERGGECVSNIYPPLSERPISRAAAVERIDMCLAWLSTWSADAPGTLSHELLPAGQCRMRAVSDERAREMAAARELAGVR